MKKAIWVLLAAGLIGAVVGYYMWNKPHKDMAAAKADESVEATALYQAFEADENAANAKYLGKTVAVTGAVKSVAKSAESITKVTLDTGADFGVVCELSTTAEHARTDFPVGEKVTFKGQCDGYNFDVQLSRCVEAK
ncbi:MAG: hypothetical protein IT269_14360 [Saprospiraceae bacterium]|nr:hypothetical protein [Saprospiraceae bacterium]